MSSPPRALPVVLLAVALLLVACGDAEGRAIAEPEPTPTATADAVPRLPDDRVEEVGGDGSAVATLDGDLEVHFIDVGQADAALILAPDATMLVDTGDWRRDDVVPYLRSVGVERLDVVAVTHPHADHIGQFDRVLNAFDVTEVWWSGATHTTATFERALDALERSDAYYEEPRAGDVTTVGSLVVEFVNPPGSADFSDLHDSGLAFRVTYGEVSFLFTGDAEAATEQRMVTSAREGLAATFYQVGHHGSRTSTSAGFLAAVAPELAVYSAGSGNQYGHPHPEVVERLLGAGIEVYGTDVHGTVVVTTDGSGWSVTTSRSGSVAAAPRASPSPTRAPVTGDADPAETSSCQAGQVDINRASFEDLQRIIHIGPDRAQQIIDLRPFASVDALTRVSGIGDARLRDIKEQGLACV